MSGRVFELVTCRHNWGEDRVYYRDEADTLCALPLAWTSLAFEDPFVSLAAGRAAFRVTDLLELSRLLASLTEAWEEPKCHTELPGDVK